MSERKTLQESFEELGRTWGELKAILLTEAAKHFYAMLAYVVLVMVGLVLIVAAFGPGVL